MRNHLLLLTLTATLALSSVPADAKPPRKAVAKLSSPSTQAEVLTVALLNTSDHTYGRDVVVIGVPGRHVVGSLLVLAAYGPTVLFHQPSDTAELPFRKFGKQAVTDSKISTLEILLALDAKHDHTVLLACPANQCALFADVSAIEHARAQAEEAAHARWQAAWAAQWAKEAREAQAEADADEHADPADLAKAKAMVDKMATLLKNTLSDVEAAGNDPSKLKEVSEDFKNNWEAIEAHVEALQKVLTHAQGKLLESYDRETIGPLKGKLLAAMFKAQSAQKP